MGSSQPTNQRDPSCSNACRLITGSFRTAGRPSGRRALRTRLPARRSLDRSSSSSLSRSTVFLCLPARAINGERECRSVGTVEYRTERSDPSMSRCQSISVHLFAVFGGVIESGRERRSAGSWNTGRSASGGGYAAKARSEAVDGSYDGAAGNGKPPALGGSCGARNPRRRRALIAWPLRLKFDRQVPI